MEPVIYTNKINPNITVYILYGIFYEMMYNMYRPLAVKFLERVGGTGIHISLFYSLPGLVAALTLLPGCVLLSRFRDKRNITSAMFLASRSIVLSMALIPLMPPDLRPMLFVCAVALLNLPESLAQTSLQEYLGGVFNDSIRAKAIALRNKFGNMCILIVTLFTGFIITFAPTTEAQRLACYQLFFILAFAAGMMEIFMFRRFRTEAPPVRRTASLSTIRVALKDKTFLAFLTSTILFQFTWQSGWPITAVYQIDVLQSTEIWFAMYAVASGLAAFLSAGFWNKRINVWGNPRTLFIASVCMALNMLFMGISPNVWVMTAMSMFAGFSTIGMNTAILNGVFLVSPEQDRIMYLGVYNTFVNISLFVSPLFGALLILWFGPQQAMFASFGLRLIGASAIFMGNRVTAKSY